MKVQLLVVSVAAALLAVCEAQDAAGFLRTLNAGDPETQNQLQNWLTDKNVPKMVDCIISRGQDPGCDRRANTIRRLIPMLHRTKMVCRGCNEAMQKSVNFFVGKIRANQPHCQRLANELQLRALCVPQ